MSRIRHEVRVLYSPALFLVLPRQISTLRYLHLVCSKIRMASTSRPKLTFWEDYTLYSESTCFFVVSFGFSFISWSRVLPTRVVIFLLIFV